MERKATLEIKFRSLLRFLQSIVENQLTYNVGILLNVKILILEKLYEIII